MFLTPQFIVPVFAGFITLGIGIFIVAVDANNVTYRRFFYAMAALGIFTIIAGFFNAFAVGNILWYNLLLISSLFIPPCIFILFATFPSAKEVLSRDVRRFAWFPVTILLLAVIFFPRQFGSEVAEVAGLPIQIPGSFYPIILAYYVVYFALGFWFLLRTFRKSFDRFRAEIGAGITGVIIATIGMFITNVVAPWFGFSQLSNFYWLGPLFVVIGVASMAYMIFEGRNVHIRLLPVIMMAFTLIVALLGQMVIAPTPSFSVFSGIILAGTLLLIVFLIRDVLVEEADRKRLERLLAQINKANQALRSADETKTEFLSIASHHLRTPLTLIKWTLTEFLEGTYGALTDEQRRLFHDLVKRNEQLVRFVHSLLDVTRIEAGRIELHLDRITMASFLEEIVLKLSPLANDYHVLISKDIPKNLPELVGDPEALSRVLENVIENAVVYNKRNGTVSLRAKYSDGNIVIIVTDTGIGISKEEMTRVGEKFFRSRAAKKQVAEGTGLGVFTAREILKMHQGSIRYESEEGNGTTVTIRLPLQSGNELKLYGRDNNEEKEFKNTTAVRKKNTKKEKSSAHPTILFIDDDSVMQELLTKRFNMEDIVLVSANDAEEGLKKARELVPDLILLDILLPGQDGFSVLTDLKKDERLQHIPVVILSNLAQREEVQKGLSLGAALYLIKTRFTPMQIVEEVKRVLEEEERK